MPLGPRKLGANEIGRGGAQCTGHDFAIVVIESPRDLLTGSEGQTFFYFGTDVATFRRVFDSIGLVVVPVK
jgi:hypothetical protein